MKPETTIDAVRIYPGGGLIYANVRYNQLLSVREALKQIKAGKAVLIALDDLYTFRVVQQITSEQ